jgi:hypothetical protein
MKMKLEQGQVSKEVVTIVVLHQLQMKKHMEVGPLG